MSFNAFWMVVGYGTPVFQHSTFESAKQEAERLSRISPGQTFYVVRSVARCKKSDVNWESADEVNEEQIPF